MNTKLANLVSDQENLLKALSKEINKSITLEGLDLNRQLDELLMLQKGIQKKYGKLLINDSALNSQFTSQVAHLEGLMKLITSADKSIFDSVDKSFEFILAQDLSTATDDNKQLITQFMTIYDRLFIGSPDTDNIFTQIKNSKDKEQQVYLYLKRMCALKLAVDSLPDAYKYKSIMLNRITDNCNYKWLKQFEQGAVSIFKCNKVNLVCLISNVIKMLVGKKQLGFILAYR